MVITEPAIREFDYRGNYENFHVIDKLDPDLWESRYGEYDRVRQLAKVTELRDVLATRGVDPKELDDAADATAQFISYAFDLYDGKITEPHDGSFAFVVPTRIERENPDYSEEATEHFPLLRYVDSETRARMLVGMCPFIIDRYGVDEQGKRGFMVFSPLFGDMMRDYGDDVMTLSTVASRVINDTARFTRDKLGVSVVGLGAILPRLTNHGRDISVDGLHTTTGHGGTVHLIAETMRSAIQRGLVSNFGGRLGVIGAGNIGSATADVILDRQIADELIISDNKPERLESVVAGLQKKYPNARVLGTLDNTEVVAKTPGLVSAVTTTFNLNADPWRQANLEGKFVLDDSQPGCFNPEELESRGAVLAWVMGRDNTRGGLLTLENFDYGLTGPASRNDVWGCQGEAGAVRITGEYDAAIRDLVTPETAKRIGRLFEEAGVGPAPLQRMGEYIVGVV